MKIVANVKVNNRNLPSYNLPSRRGRRCTVTLWKKGIDHFYVTIQSSDDRPGTEYKVIGNVVRVFDKYAKDGKASVIFKDPPHDVLIHCEGADLIKFLKALKLVLGGNATPCLLATTNPRPLKKIPPKPPTSVAITKKEDYLLLNSFPRNCRFVQINGIEQRIFDSRLLGLMELETLDLSGNSLCSIPEEIDLLPKLKSLNLSYNMFNLCRDWKWICGENIGKSLEVLNLCHNKLMHLPACMRRLGALHTLRLDYNNLSEIPSGIGILQKLKVLSLSHNELKYLPGSFTRLSLHELYIGDNKFFMGTSSPPYTVWSNWCPSLRNLAACAVVDHRIQFGEYDLPRTLHDLIDEAKFCVCGRAMFSWCGEFLKAFNLHNIVQHLLLSDGIVSGIIFLKICLCSKKCISSFLRKERKVIDGILNPVVE